MSEEKLDISGFDNLLNTEKLQRMLEELPGKKERSPYSKWEPIDAIDWAVGFIREYGIIGTDEEIMLWPSKIPPDLEESNYQLLRFKEVDWVRNGLIDWFACYLLIKKMMRHADEFDSATQSSPSLVKAMLDLIVEHKLNCV